MNFYLSRQLTKIICNLSLKLWRKLFEVWKLFLEFSFLDSLDFQFFEFSWFSVFLIFSFLNSGFSIFCCNLFFRLWRLFSEVEKLFSGFLVFRFLIFWIQFSWFSVFNFTALFIRRHIFIAPVPYIYCTTATFLWHSYATDL